MVLILVSYSLVLLLHNVLPITVNCENEETIFSSYNLFWVYEICDCAFFHSSTKTASAFQRDFSSSFPQRKTSRNHTSTLPSVTQPPLPSLEGKGEGNVLVCSVCSGLWHTISCSVTFHVCFLSIHHNKAWPWHVSCQLWQRFMYDEPAWILETCS